MHPKIVFLLYRKIIMLIFINLERWLCVPLNQGSVLTLLCHLSKHHTHTLRSSPDFSSQFLRERATCCSKILIIHRAWWALPFFFFFLKLKKAFLPNRNHWKASWTQQEHRAGFSYNVCLFGIPECQQWCQFSSHSQHLFVSFQDYNNLCSITGLPRGTLYITFNKLQNHCHVTDTTISHIKKL